MEKYGLMSNILFTYPFQAEDIDLPASAAAGPRGVPAELPDGGVPPPGPTVPDPHPASPARPGPQAPPGAAGPGGLHRERGSW